MSPAEQATGVSLRATHIQNAIDRMRNDINLASACVRWLIGQGYIPTHVDAGESNKPIVWIEPKPYCKRLKHECGAHYYKVEGMPGFEVRTWRADVLGCYVQWLETRARGAH